MTVQRDLKDRIRARMKKTGERYTAARANILQSLTKPERSNDAATVGLFDGYELVGGVCRDTGALRNVLACAGVVNPATKQPFSEAFLTGLCGGIGFLYAVFEYKGMPPLLSVLMRYDAMSDTFVGRGLERLGVSFEKHETTGAKGAAKALANAIASEQPALAVVDPGGLATRGKAHVGAGMAPTVVGIAGSDGDDVVIDDGGLTPLRLTAAELNGARALYKKAKNRLLTISDATTADGLDERVREAIRETVKRFYVSPWKAFAANVGLTGIEKWQRLLTDAKDKKGWPKVFPDDSLACLALRRAYQGIEHEFTAPAGGRALYADFLEEAAQIVNDSNLKKVAKHFTKAADAWSVASGFIASCGVPDVETGCQVLDDYKRWLDDQRDPATKPVVPFGPPSGKPTPVPEVTADRARDLYAELAEKIGACLAADRAAVETLAEAVGATEFVSQGT